MIPLHRRYPETTALPWVGLGTLPTSVERWRGLAEAAAGLPAGQASLWVKRDDRTAAAYGGNKVRKLEFLLGTALAEGRPAVLTFGAVGSNHVLATAVHGARLGLDVHAILVPQPRTSYLARNLLADLGAGATLHTADSLEASPRRAVAVRAEVAAAHGGVEPLVIPFGGTSPVGVLGFVNAGLELADAIEAGEMPVPDVVYVPLGSMGTVAGLALALAAVGLPTRIQAVRVLPPAADGSLTVASVAAGTLAALREAAPGFPAVDTGTLPVDVRDGFLGEGYALATKECREAVGVAAETGLALETTYTGKALAAMLADLRAGRLDGKTALFWDTYDARHVEPLGDVRDLPPELRVYIDEA